MRLALSRKSHIYALLISALVLADMASKEWALNVLKSEPFGYMPALKGVFSFSFMWNEGAAFSLFRDHPLIVTIVSAVILFLVCLAIFCTRLMTPRVRVAACLIFAGGLGNLIDRFRFSAVVEFIQFDFISFPVFNFADICVTGGAILYVAALFFPRPKASAK